MLTWSIVVALATLRLVSSQTTNAVCKSGNEGVSSPCYLQPATLTVSFQLFNSLGQSPCLMAAYIMGACQPDGSESRRPSERRCYRN